MKIDGKKIAQDCIENLKIKYDELVKKSGRDAMLVVIMVGDNYASRIYVKNKEKSCEKIGIKPKTIVLDENISENDLIDLIKKFNNDKTVDGILVQLPLPAHMDQIKICSYIDDEKDVDGFTPNNIGKLLLGKDGLKPATANAVVKILNTHNIPIAGSDVVIIGRSNIVGKPLSMMLTNMSATVQTCHRQTKNIDDKIKNADIIIAAAGYKNLINETHKFKNGVTLIDVGINRDNNGKLCGDIAFDKLIDNQNVKYITPVPGGVGPVTVACLMENIIEGFERNINEKNID
ncbi:bifunctional 5,10-methylenetetrahydrofolate dehydrogenase/5,10-methenyltetrahydrofolate cyclohydrolase [Oceanivirga salmonicida]|uniref:bifunctional 5,10-methylenetetrahydrofolate dehydrogenase/5,10-methenyltetrahydrofolate cyclohydrolase n=1 Tax=Oceanivirga salmonicida TaxID=1769291 RepID=UPI0008332468|nr:bifunctional 5,10-methylenetetrahydrofolate dehydrogenase/5,10-methenyltetrahydrofolate cyclohydrolase [Oceanivirga salmonicida]